MSDSHRLLYFVTEDWFFCSHFIDRAVAAQEAGYEVLVLTRVRQHGDRIRAAGLSLVPLEMRRRGLNPLAELGTVFKVYRAYREYAPKLVHHFALKPIIYGTLAARLSGLSRVVNAPVGMGFVFSSGSRLARALRPLVNLLLHALMNPAGSRVVFENPDDLGSAVDSGLVRQRDAVLIRGAGVNLERFRELPEPEGVPTVVLVARLLWDKGVGEYVEAARALKTKGLDVRFFLVGAPDPENPAAIAEGQLENWQRDGVVEWLGQREDIPEILASSHVVCLPSYREGLPKSLLEALAAGRPIVATDVPGCRETVRDGENGLLVPSHDAGALAAALETLLGDAGLRRDFGRRGRRMAEEDFSTAAVNGATLALYEEMLADG